MDSLDSIEPPPVRSPWQFARVSGPPFTAPIAQAGPDVFRSGVTLPNLTKMSGNPNRNGDLPGGQALGNRPRNPGFLILPNGFLRPLALHEYGTLSWSF
jgi:hypothetical protein